MKRFLFCVLYTGLIIFFSIERANGLNELKLQIPILEKETKRIERENEKIAFELTQFSNPAHLLKLLEEPQSSHLKFPKANEVKFE